MEHVKKIADCRARRRCHHADRAREFRHRQFAGGIEQAFRREAGFERFELRLQRANPGFLHLLDD